MLNKKGEGIVELQGHIFEARRRGEQDPIKQDLVLIVEGDEECVEEGEYRNGDIYKVVEVVKDGIYINKQWTDEEYYDEDDEEIEAQIFLFDDEYTILEPTSMGAILFALTMESAEVQNYVKPLSEMNEEEDDISEEVEEGNIDELLDRLMNLAGGSEDIDEPTESKCDTCPAYDICDLSIKGEM